MEAEVLELSGADASITGQIVDPEDDDWQWDLSSKMGKGSTRH
jgi:hypothetical protein